MNHEEALINSFIVSARRNRYLEFVRNPKNRGKFIARLPHFNDLDWRFVFSIPGIQQTPVAIEDLLRSRGAGSKCWVISTDREIDGRESDLSTALERTVGEQAGTFLSCVPGKLAYFEDEDGRFVLER